MIGDELTKKRPDFMRSIFELTAKASNILVRIAGLLIFLNVIVIVVEIVTRALFPISFNVSVELSGYILALSTSLVFAYALINKEHIRINVFYNALPKSVQVFFDVIVFVLTAAICTFIAVEAVDMVLSALEYGDMSLNMRVPLWIPYAIWTLGLIWFALSAFIMLIYGLLSIFMGDLEQASEIIGCKKDDFSDLHNGSHHQITQKDYH